MVSAAGFLALMWLGAGIGMLLAVHGLVPDCAAIAGLALPAVVEAFMIASAWAMDLIDRLRAARRERGR